jgi:hypothetical protein
MNNAYKKFLETKGIKKDLQGFKPLWMPDFLYDFQKELVDWSVRKGRSAIFADCGLGKSVMELVWAKNIVKKTKGNVLLLTPIAVGMQMLEEANKFGIKGVRRSKKGTVKGRITISNYERLHYFNPSDFAGIILDESSILKNFNGVTKNRINIFVRNIRYRLLATATAAPNDFIELGTSSEALGYLGYMDMLSKFFKNEQNNCATNARTRFTESTKWRLKGHAHNSFWKWVTSWSRSIRYPSDMGYEDGAFRLPKLREIEYELSVSRGVEDGAFFALPARGLKEVRDERRATIVSRCEKVSEIINNTKDYAVVWCNLNDEGDLLEKLIPDAIQVSGRDSDDIKESKLDSFTHCNDRVLITKPKIGAWGLNWQHCNQVTFFPAYSYEQYYQAIRRCWRFGQKKRVQVHLIYTRGDRNSIKNLRRKQIQADDMFVNLVREMKSSLDVQNLTRFNKKVESPKWE